MKEQTKERLEKIQKIRVFITSNMIYEDYQDGTDFDLMLISKFQEMRDWVHEND